MFWNLLGGASAAAYKPSIHTGRTTITGRQSTLNENPPIKTDIPHEKEKPTAIRLVLPTNTFEKEV